MSHYGVTLCHIYARILAHLDENVTHLHNIINIHPGALNYFNYRDFQIRKKQVYFNYTRTKQSGIVLGKV